MSASLTEVPCRFWRRKGLSWGRAGTSRLDSNLLKAQSGGSGLWPGKGAVTAVHPELQTEDRQLEMPPGVQGRAL